MRNRIPLFDVSTEAEEIEADVQQILGDLLRDPNSIDIRQTLENAVAEHLDVANVFAMESIVEAYLIGLDSLGLAPGDEVILPSLCSPLVPNIVRMLGAVPIIVDVSPTTFNISAESIEEALTSETRIVVVPHLYGYPADMNRIFDIALLFGLEVLEDATWAFGAQYQQFYTGTLGDMAVMNLSNGSNFSTFGKAALLITDDEDLGRMARMLRFHEDIMGYGSAMASMQAASLFAKLERIEEWNQNRRQLANLYNIHLNDIPGIKTPPTPTLEIEPTYTSYVIRVKDGRRAAVQAFLRDNGIDTRAHFPVPLHWLPNDAQVDGQFMRAEQAADELLCLPMWPHLAEHELLWVVETLKKAVKSMPQRR